MNGRNTLRNDFTFVSTRGTSVVDYCICTVNFLCHIISLTVLEFSSLYSDVHSPLTLYINFKLDATNLNNSVDIPNNEKSDKIKKWSPEK